ncbi:hypothetical protein MLD38_010529 [Melastoma candidum]|uniref:Uncharacterized protein n=1 Tax=Melastoma candidum TaxID=119954 RepID=A0ACB9R068_9MYRT|nr:hypothetical protein MLD38_010529 [Melastoma candidum]
MGRFLIYVLLMIGVVMVSGVKGGGEQSLGGWFPGYGGGGGGGGAVVEDEQVEFLMDSEISRRILATTKYISYGALQRDTVPCSRRGASYYNCQAGASGNPYTRGCSAITRCRG